MRPTCILLTLTAARGRSIRLSNLRPQHLVTLELPVKLVKGLTIAEVQRRLLEIVLDAVGRTNGLVTGLLAYARPLQPRRDVLALDALVTEQLSWCPLASTKAHQAGCLSLGSTCAWTTSPREWDHPAT